MITRDGIGSRFIAILFAAQQQGGDRKARNIPTNLFISRSRSESIGPAGKYLEPGAR
jgi:hypothetical protein